MTDKFTPGPWTLHRYAEAAVVGSSGWVVAACGGYSNNSRDPTELREELRANATLIAAAPDMYAALDLIDELVRECLLGATKLADDDERLARVTSAIDSARSALARAEGRP